MYNYKYNEDRDKTLFLIFLYNFMTKYGIINKNQRMTLLIKNVK